jgi:hypothetical protein
MKMNSQQLDLFQPLGEHESSIFEQAKLAKSVIQKQYNSLHIPIQNTRELLSEKYAILCLDIQLELVGDSDTNRELNSPRVFIWQFTPSFKLLVKNEAVLIDNITPSLLEPKIVKKWINTLYTSSTFSQAEFHSIASQYFALEVLSNALSDNDFIDKIESKQCDRSLIIYFEHKLLPSKTFGVNSFMESDMLRKVNNYYKRLVSLQKKNWSLVSSYESFNDKNTLLTDLDNSIIINEKRKEARTKVSEYKSLNEIFQNDFLFLNNSTFFEKKLNTHGWDEDFVLSPEILNIDFSDIDNNKLIISSRKGDFEKKEFYFYSKKKKDSSFIRTDILIPSSYFESSKLKEIISLAHDLRNE